MICYSWMAEGADLVENFADVYMYFWYSHSLSSSLTEAPLLVLGSSHPSRSFSFNVTTVFSVFITHQD